MRVIVGPSVPKSLRVLESSHIEVTGFVDSVVPYYESATVLVSAMEAGAGVKAKALEAMAAGLPVVGTRETFSGIQAKRGMNALVGPMAELAGLATSVMDDAELWNTISAGGRSLIESGYTSEGSIDRYVELFRSLAQKNAANPPEARLSA